MIARALAAALALSVAGHAVQWWRLDSAQDEIAAVQAGMVQAALIYAESARQIEQQHQQRISDAQQARETEQARSRRAADRLRTERDGLRDQIAAYATGPGDDTAAACGERAATLGVLLDDALRTAAACAAGAEQHATDVRTLRGAWPVAP